MRGFGSLFPRLSQYPRRLLPVACMVATLGFAALCGWALLLDRQDAARQAGRTAGNIAAMAAQDIAGNLTLYDLSLQAVSRGMDLPGLWDLSPELRQMVLFDRAAAAVQFGFLNVLNESGDVVADLQSKVPRLANYANRDYFTAVRQDPQDQLFISRPVLTGPRQTATVPMARRRSHPDGSFAGVVVGSMRLAPIQALFASLDLGSQGSIALMRTDGVILMRLPFDPDDVGRKILPGPRPFDVLGDGTPLVEAIDADRVTRITARHRVGELALVVSVGLADSDVYHAWWSKAATLTAALCVLLGLNFMLLRTLGRAEAARVGAEAAARHAEIEQARIVTTVSHELRTPLTSLLCYVEMLEEAQLPPEHAARVAALGSAGEHLRTVIDRQIDFTQADKLINAPQATPAQLDTLVAQCCKIVEPFAARRGLVLTSQIASTLPRWVAVDSGQLRMVLGNLLSNAVKYTERGNIRLTATGASGRLRFEVADTGPGIPRDKRDRLFTEHDRLDADGSQAGLGIGLFTARRLVTGMLGTIGYSDNPGGGSVFWIEIPLAEAAEPAAPSPSAVRLATEPGLRILLAEDDATNRDVAVTLLGDAGHQVTVASNGAEALHIAASEDFDIVVTDMRMPRMNGLEVARRIRGLQGPRSRTPIMLLTADMQVGKQSGYEEARITLLMPKPYNRVQLLAAVRAAVDAPSPAATRVPDSPSLLNEAVLNELSAAIGSDAVQGHLRTLSVRICDLLGLLRRPERDDDRELCDAAHDTGSAAGLLGLGTLSVALQRFQQLRPEERATETEASAVIAIAEKSLGVLHGRLGNHVQEPA